MPQPESLKTASHLKHKDGRSRFHLYESEVEALIQAAKEGLNQIRDQTLILICYTHGLRSEETRNLEWRDIDHVLECSDIDRVNGKIHIRRANGRSSANQLSEREMRLLRQLYKERHNNTNVFTTRSGGPLTAGNFAKIMVNTGARAGLLMKVHPYQLRDSTVYKLLSEGVDAKTVQEYLGHSTRQHTLRYKEPPA